MSPRVVESESDCDCEPDRDCRVVTSSPSWRLRSRLGGLIRQDRFAARGTDLIDRQVFRQSLNPRHRLVGRHQIVAVRPFPDPQEIIIVNGKNLYAGDVEDRVGAAQGVRPGRAVAFGIENPALGTEELIVVAESDPASGLSESAVKAGIKPTTDRLDVALVCCDKPCVAAGVYTANQVRAACVTWAENVTQKRKRVQAVLFNSGNAIRSDRR